MRLMVLYFGEARTASRHCPLSRGGTPDLYQFATTLDVRDQTLVVLRTGPLPPTSRTSR